MPPFLDLSSDHFSFLKLSHRRLNSCFCFYLFIYLSICLFVVCLFICLFISGLWEGYFVDNRALRGKSAGSEWLIDVDMTFQSRDQFTARGSDEIGSFTFKNGKITGACSTQYIKAKQKWCF